MHLLTRIGILIGCLTTSAGHLMKKFPNLLAILLYIVAMVLMTTGLVISGKGRNR